MTDREKALALFKQLEEMTCVMEGEPEAEDPDDREDVVEPMFDVRLAATSNQNDSYEAERFWSLHVKWSEARGLGFLDGNDELRQVLDLATEFGGKVQLENFALEIVL